MWYLVGVLLISMATGQETVCGPIPSTFIDPGDTHFISGHKAYEVVQINAYLMPYHVFDVKGYVSGTIWHRSGSVELQTLNGRGQGLLVHIANTDWINMTSLTGDIYSKHTENETDLDLIRSYICADFRPQEALVTTFDCLREADDERSPKARYQITLVFGHDSNGQNKSFVLIITDVLPGQAWDYLSSAKYRYYLYFDSEYYPIPVTTHGVMAIDVTSKQKFTPDAQPDVLIPPCGSGKVTCTLTRAGVLTDFSGNVTTSPKTKVILAEWNPGLDTCKFKLITNFKGGYLWTCLAVGLRPKTDKYFRYIDFDRTDGKISQRGFKCKNSCQDGPSAFPYVVDDVSTNTTYATIEELEQDKKYTIKAVQCTQDSQPNYKFTYDFSASDSQPLARLEIDADFYSANKHQMSGLCLGDTP